MADDVLQSCDKLSEATPSDGLNHAGARGTMPHIPRSHAYFKPILNYRNTGELEKDEQPKGAACEP